MGAAHLSNGGRWGADEPEKLITADSHHNDVSTAQTGAFFFFYFKYAREHLSICRSGALVFSLIAGCLVHRAAFLA